MKDKLIVGFRILFAVVIGEAVLVLGTTFVQELIFGGIGWTESSFLELLFGSLGSILAAAAGAAAYMIVRKRSNLPLIIISLLILAETIWLIASGRTHDPVWFSLLGGASLILGIWLGKWAMTADLSESALANQTS